MVPYQVQLEAALRSFTGVSAFMQREWSWPALESIHFIGLTMLLGSIGAWDLRLLGVAKQVPIAAFHRLIPIAVIGFAINAASGTFFLMTFPDQYVYNPAFHLKMLCVMLAGANVAVFYLTAFRGVRSLESGSQASMLGQINGAVSLTLWITVIICGRMITFFRPSVCRAGEALAFLAECIVR
jgi:hypothetical protein